MKHIVWTVAACLLTLATSAQKIQWTKGDLSVLKGQKSVATRIDYEGMQVSDLSEKAFLEERRANFNAEKPGDGDKFCENWEAAKKPNDGKFVKRFNEHFTKASKEKVSAGSNDGNYLIILKPTSMDLGKGRYFGTKPALVDFDIMIVEAANPSNIVAQGSVKGVKGESKAPKGSKWIPGAAGTAIDVSNRVQNFDATNRLAESFELLAVAMGKAVK